MKVVIVGGGAAGTRAAIEIRKRKRDAEILIVNDQPYREYSPCGMPFVLSGEVEGFDDIQNLDKRFYEKMKIELILDERVKKIDSKNKKIFYGTSEQNYDKLVIATGSYAFAPPIKGIDRENVIVFKKMDDAKRINEKMAHAKKAVIIGAGLIGLETAYACVKHGIETTVVEMLDSIVPVMLDADMAAILTEHLEENGITIYRNEKIVEIGDVVKTEKRDLPYDFVVVSAGVQPNIDLAKKTGIEANDGIIVNERIETNIPTIYACGDCVECVDFVTGKPIMSQLATTAMRQATVLAENITGGNAAFGPVLNTSITKLFGVEIGSTGLTTDRAQKEGIPIIKGKYRGKTRPEYMDGSDLIVKIIADAAGRMLGAQMIGECLVGRMDAICLAILNKMTVMDLANTEYCYAPPVSPEFEPMYLACEMAARRVR
jgi:NADH oxidase (H2O2-forming)